MSSKVLIVDDEPNILMSLEFLLKKSGYKVFIARDGREALDIVEKELPDIILLDVMMPEVDGYEVCQKIKNDKETAHIKIVFLSAKTKQEDIDKGYELGAVLYITKPFSSRNLITKVDSLKTP